MHIFDARITAITPATPSIHALRLAIPDASFRFLPGQWVDLSITLDGTPHTAGYSITTSPLHSDQIELAIKASTRHPLARWVHETARVGDRVTVTQGQGPFVYLPEMSDNVVLIGGGVGITPLLSIFRHVRDAALPTQAHLVYSVSDSSEILFHDELESAVQSHPNLHLSITVTQPDPHWHGLTGRIDPVKLHALDVPDDTLYYLCGPKGMVEDMSTLLHGLGVPMNRIIFEKWW
ncbi:MAG: FAD-dependent oxidoreductase [Thiobacillus sp.]|nr:FAD-dependent oxidoreductase [Thiobacillus sp.]MDP3124384.1 FAD-dependent oxidoreductase [Thiobacillus sp.]